MSKFSDFLEAQNGGKKEPIKGELVQGTFGCQTCYEYMDDAEYFHLQKLLKWKCSSDHISFIEEFTL